MSSPGNAGAVALILPELYVDSERDRMIDGLRKHASIEVIGEPEQEQIEGNASAIDRETDREIALWIRDELARGNGWAWCVIDVFAHWREHTGQDQLGGCSYESKRAFIHESGCYDDMVTHALGGIVDSVMESGDDEERAFLRRHARRARARR